MSIPEPKTWNGAPGEVYGDDHKGGGRSMRVKFECADCGWLGVNAIVAREHHEFYQHRVLHFPSREIAIFPSAASDKRTA